MRNVLLPVCVSCLCVSVAFCEDRPGTGRDRAPAAAEKREAGDRKPADRGGQRAPAFPRELGPEFAMLRDTLAGLRLSDEELNQTQPLTERYQTILADEIGKTKLAVRDKLIEEIRGVLTEDHKVQLGIVVAAMRIYETALTAATKEFNAKLDELGLSDLKGCQTERDMTLRMFARTDDARGKLKTLYGKFEQSRNDAIAKLPPPDPNNKKAGRGYYEERAKLEKAAEAQLLEEVRAALTAEQQAVPTENLIHRQDDSRTDRAS